MKAHLQLTPQVTLDARMSGWRGIRELKDLKTYFDQRFNETAMIIQEA